jgi:YTH domain-containing protein 1
VANTRFHRVGHIKNRFNENQPVLVGRDGQEIEEIAGAELLKLIDEEAERLLIRNSKEPVPTLWDD